METTSQQFRVRLAVILVFVLGCATFAVWFFLQTGIHVTGVNVGEYRVSFETNDVNALVNDGEVRIAGVTVGRVTHLNSSGPDGKADVELAINQGVAPLHQGATVRIGLKSLIGASFVDVVDGKGPPIESGTRLPDSAVIPPVEIPDVIRNLTPQSRVALTGAVRSLGAATAGRGQDINELATGLGTLGRQGYTAIDAIAAQSKDLESVAQEATTLVNALDTGNGQIAHVVDNADAITQATSGQQDALASSVRQLPGVITSADEATKKLNDLSGPLAPVAADLKAAAPDLNQALLQLPGTTKDLRGLLPSLDGTLDRAPATLDRVPQLGEDVRGLVPQLSPLLQDANPMLAYGAPYGKDAATMLANFGSALKYNAPNGVNPLRLTPVFNTQTVRNVPLPNTSLLDPLTWKNPYPAPGSSGTPRPYQGPAPRVDQEPAPR